MKISDFLIQIVTVTHATKLKWDPYFTQDRIEQLIDTPEKAVSVILENGESFDKKTFVLMVPLKMMIKRISGKFSIKDSLDPSSIAWGTFTDSLNITGTDRPLFLVWSVRYEFQANFTSQNRL